MNLSLELKTISDYLLLIIAIITTFLIQGLFYHRDISFANYVFPVRKSRVKVGSTWILKSEVKELIN